MIPERTSSYRFHQYFVQVADEDVERSLLQFTMLPVREIAEVVEAHQRDPGHREAQRRLANEVTSLVHGQVAAAAAEAAARILFGSPVDDMDEVAIKAVAAEVPTSDISLTPDGGFDAASNSFDLVELLASTGLATSKGDARRGLSEGSVYVNNQSGLRRGSHRGRRSPAARPLPAASPRQAPPPPAESGRKVIP